MNKMNRIKGFTLVELLVVISIISILTIITVSQFQTAKRKGNDVQRKSDLSSVSKALLMYYADYGKFPISTSVNGGAITIASWGGTFQDTTTPPYVYMKVMPKENYNLKQYCYKTSPDFKKFALFAQLENKADKDCGTPNNHAYSCNGNTYCYGIVSPNSSLDPTNGDLL